MKKIHSLTVLVALIGALFCSCATTRSTTGPYSSVPLPQDVKVIPPGPEASPKTMPFSGMWGGRWRGQTNSNVLAVDAVLVVEKLRKEKADVVYAWEDPLSVQKGWVRVKGTFREDTEGTYLEVRGRRARWRFRVDGNQLRGTMDGYDSLVIEMDRIE